MRPGAKQSCFPGFSADALAFFAGLAADNSRAYFEAHCAVYGSEVVLPAKALVADVGARVKAQVSDGLQADPKVGRSLFRINRDLRFSKDKTPYNPWVDMLFWEGVNPRRSPALILRVGPTYVVSGAGIMGMRGANLARFRAFVAADTTGVALVKLLREASDYLPGLQLTEPRLARVPPGYAIDHPRAELLRCETFHVSVREDTPSEIRGPQFVDWLLARYVRFAPVHNWLVNANCPV